jgi:quinol-cytochrome oxidoreductase complex cytochrome b subunit/mono/diheme cytochrome c family protein
LRDQLSDWLESRTGLRSGFRSVVGEPMPGGARWRHVFGPALAATFLIQLATGLLLMSSYVPSSSQAWGSVWYIQTQMVLGWFIRGLHHWGSSAMMILLGMHLLQVVFTAAYRAPREVNWWLGLGLAGLVFGLALTGYLLPWDQKGYWATRVATNIAGSTPGIGPYLLTVVLGGTEYGNQTLTRLFSLHVGVLPLGILVLLVLHVRLYYKHGATAPRNAVGSEPAWPGQVFRNLAAAGVVAAVLIGWTIYNGGANLEAPADPSVSDYPARPEWYFLPLFQMLNHLVSPFEVLGTHVGPGLLFGFLAALPLLDRVLPRKFVHATASLVMLFVVAGAGFLMTEAVLADRGNDTFQVTRQKADAHRERALQLAALEGVPPDGAIYLLRRDPLTRGREVLTQNCLSCHVFGGHGQQTRVDLVVSAEDRAKATPAAIPDLPEPAARALTAAFPGFVPDAGQAAPGSLRDRGAAAVLTGRSAAGEPLNLVVAADGSVVRGVQESKPTASDLKGFGTRDWVRGLLENPSDPKYFGNTPALKGMKTWRKRTKLSPQELDTVADFVAALAKVEPGEGEDDWYGRAYSGKLEEHPGAALFANDCGACHAIGEPGLITEGGEMDAPNLFAYGSRDWTRQMVLNPGADHLYGYLDETDRMPAFAGRLSESDLETMLKFLAGDYVPAGPAGAPAAAEARPAEVAAGGTD